MGEGEKSLSKYEKNVKAINFISYIPFHSTKCILINKNTCTLTKD